jgi:hypothetical protein
MTQAASNKDVGERIKGIKAGAIIRDKKKPRPLGNV